MSNFTVYKRDHSGNIILQYEGRLVSRSATSVCIAALYQQTTRDLGYMLLRQGDSFTEWFYSNRWYNIFLIRDVDHRRLKGFYCNFTRPAEIGDDVVAADDLALDLFVHPDGSIQLLDEAEYAALDLPLHEQQAVRAALADLQQRIAARRGPFFALSSPLA